MENGSTQTTFGERIRQQVKYATKPNHSHFLILDVVAGQIDDDDELDLAVR